MEGVERREEPGGKREDMEIREWDKVPYQHFFFSTFGLLKF